MKNILVVDDYQTNGLLIKQALPEEEYSVKTVSSGEQALNSLRSREEDLILLDIMMPDMDGIETLKKIKENPDTRHIPVLFLTGQADKQKILEGFSLGIVDIIAKPIVANLAKDRIERALRGASPGQMASKTEKTDKADQIDREELDYSDVQIDDEDDMEDADFTDSFSEEMDEGIW